MHVHKPKFFAGSWQIIVTRTISPLSEVVETVKCGSYPQAFGEYKRLIVEKQVNITIHALILHQTDRAYLLQKNHLCTAWISKKDIVNHEDGSFTLSLALAIEKGIE